MNYKLYTPGYLKDIKDIRFWILFFFLLRMYGITMPPLEVGHNWRQTDGLMIARNFYEHAAFNSSILLLVSLWFSYSRKNIPDAFAVSFCLVSLYFAFQYFESGKLLNLLLFFAFALFGCLAKISAATILTVLLIPVL